MNVLVTAQGRTDWLDPLRWGILSRVARRPGDRVAQVLRGDSVVEERALRELADAGWLSIRNETLEQPLAGPNVRLTPVGEEAVASGLAWIRSIGTPRGTPGTADPRIRPELLRKRTRTRGNRAAGRYTSVVKDTGGTLRFAYQGPSLAIAQDKARAAAAAWGLPAIVVDDRWNEVASYDPPGGDDAPTVRNRAMPIDPRIAEAAARFPPTFGLRWYAGSVFRVSPESSYVMTDARGNEEVVLYTQRRMPDGAWLDFAKGAPEELAREVVPLGDRNRARPTSEKKRREAEALRLVEAGADLLEGAPVSFEWDKRAGRSFAPLAGVLWVHFTLFDGRGKSEMVSWDDRGPYLYHAGTKWRWTEGGTRGSKGMLVPERTGGGW